jgi:hypothetical protein
MIKRREFISLLGGATAWPLAARAQQPERMAVASSDCGTGGRAAWRTGGPDGKRSVRFAPNGSPVVLPKSPARHRALGA